MESKLRRIVQLQHIASSLISKEILVPDKIRALSKVTNEKLGGMKFLIKFLSMWPACLGKSLNIEKCRFR